MKTDRKKRLEKKKEKGTKGRGGANKTSNKVEEAKEKKLYLVDLAFGSLEVQVNEVTIIKASEKMYKLGNCTSRTNLNKTDLDTLVGWNRTSVFTFDPKVGKAMVLKRCEEELAKNKDLVKKYTKAIKDLK